MRVKLKSFILMVALIGLISGVFGQASTDTVPTLHKVIAVNEIQGKWYLIPVLDSDTATGHLPEIDFVVEQSHFSGSTGCNRMSGSFLATDSSLHFSQNMITTRMFCPGYNESAFLKNLLRVDGYKLKKGILILTANGIEISHWSRKMAKLQKSGKA